MRKAAALLVFTMLSFGLASLCPAIAAAESSQGGFSVQVTPSPLLATLTPGKTSTLELRINNTSSSRDSFRMDLRAFSADPETGKVNLGNDTPKDVAAIVSFEKPTFSLEPGEWLEQRIVVATPSDAGFSYNFAILVSRDEQQSSGGTAAIHGSVAVFALLNVDRPDATRKLELLEFSSAKKVYEYLPATLELKLKNTGTTSVAPQGNIFIARGGSEKTYTKVLTINDQGGYVVPDSIRTLSQTWADGFPVIESSASATKVKWDFSKLNNFRIGRYTAKAVLIYDDGTRDIPLEAEVQFWVIPWKIILGLMVIVALIITGFVTLLKKSSKLMRRKTNVKNTQE